MPGRKIFIVTVLTVVIVGGIDAFLLFISILAWEMYHIVNTSIHTATL